MSVLGPPPLAGSNPVSETPCPFCSFLNPVGSATCGSCGRSLAINAPPLSPSGKGTAPLPITPNSPAQAVPAGVSDSYIAVWGPESAGKTMYLYLLRDAFSLYKYKNEWPFMSPANDEAKSFLNVAGRRFDRHLFPEQTQISSTDEMWFIFTNRVPRGKDNTYLMKVRDVSGELYKQDASKNKILHDYLQDSKGILCLIDPDRRGDNPMMAYLRNLLDTMFLNANQQPINKRLAFCLTKMDQLKHRGYLTKPEEYITQILGATVMDRIKILIAPGNLEFFSCSAIGFYPYPNESPHQKSHQRSNGGINWRGENIIYDVKNHQPYGLFEPVVWLYTGRK